MMLVIMTTVMIMMKVLVLLLPKLYPLSTTAPKTKVSAKMVLDAKTDQPHTIASARTTGPATTATDKTPNLATMAMEQLQLLLPTVDQKKVDCTLASLSPKCHLCV